MFICTHVQPYFQLKTLMDSQVVIDIATNNAAVVDPVLDDNFKSGDFHTKAADALLAHVRYGTLQSNVFLRRTPMRTTRQALVTSKSVLVGKLSSVKCSRKEKHARVTLGLPMLILPSTQVSVRAGVLIQADANGVANLRIPLNILPIRK